MLQTTPTRCPAELETRWPMLAFHSQSIMSPYRWIQPNPASASQVSTLLGVSFGKGKGRYGLRSLQRRNKKSLYADDCKPIVDNSCYHDLQQDIYSISRSVSCTSMLQSASVCCWLHWNVNPSLPYLDSELWESRFCHSFPLISTVPLTSIILKCFSLLIISTLYLSLAFGCVSSMGPTPTEVYTSRRLRMSVPSIIGEQSEPT